MPAEILQAIESHHLFSGLDDDLVRNIARSAQKKTLGSNQVLFRKGDRANAMWGVLSGRIVTQVRADDGKELVLDTFEAGDVFGEVGVLDFGPRPVDAIAETRTELFRLERSQFLRHLQSSPELSFRILSLLCNDLRETTEELEATALYTLPGRLAKKLTALVRDEDRKPKGGSPVLSISHIELARLLGVHRVSVSRQLSQWEKAGILSSGRRRIEIRDFQALESLAAPGGREKESGDSGWNTADLNTWPSRELAGVVSSAAAGPTLESGFRGILAVDAAEYSQSLVHDAAGTLKRLRVGMRAIDKAISDGGGRLISHSGDRVLADFSGADKAHQAAMAIHERTSRTGILGSAQVQSIFRMGVHYGEVSIGEDGYLGEAVNIAIRLTELSGAGDVCLTGQAREKLDLPDIPELQFLGDHELKNVSGRVPVFSARPIPAVRMLALRAETLVPRRFRPAAFAAGLIVLLAGVWFSGEQIGRKNVPPALSPVSIAVLPFTASGDPADDYLARGISAEVRTMLSAVPGLRVIGRDSVDYFADRQASTEEIGKSLDVSWLLQGNIDSSSLQATATAQLVKVANNKLVWEKQFLESAEGFIGFAPEIVRALANTLGATGDGAGLPQLVPLTADREAHALFLEAQSHIWRGRQRNMIKAVPLLEAAIDRNPSFAGAHAVLGVLYLQSPILDNQPAYTAERRRDLARQSLQRALELSPDSPLVLAKAAQARLLENDYEGGAALAQRAIRIDPNNVEALRALYWAQFERQDWSGALRTTERLMLLEPLSTNSLNARFTELTRADRHQQALAVARRALALYPESQIPYAHAWAAISQRKLGDRLGAIVSSRKGMPYGVPVDLWTGLDYDWEFVDEVDRVRAAIGLVYVEEYERVRQLLIDEWDAAEPGAAGANDPNYLVNRGVLEALDGSFELALEFFENAQSLTIDEEGGLSEVKITMPVLEWSRQSDWTLALLLTCRKTGQHEKADVVARQFEAWVAEYIAAIAEVSDFADHHYLYARAQFYAIEGRTDEALGMLQTWADHEVDIFTYIKWDPFLENLRGDPEFEAIVAEVEAALARVRAQHHAKQAALAGASRG